jgi:hypothetical protein
MNQLPTNLKTKTGLLAATLVVAATLIPVSTSKAAAPVSLSGEHQPYRHHYVVADSRPIGSIPPRPWP